MPRPEPLPFRLPLAGSDTIDVDGAKSVSYRVEGFLHLEERALQLEWTGTERTQQVSFARVRDDVDHFPVAWAEIPFDWITRVRLLGGWWRPRLEIHSDHPEAFADIPSARESSIVLRLHRRDRRGAAHVIAAIERGRAARRVAG